MRRFALVAAVLSLAVPVRAAEIRSGEVVTVPEGEVLEDDLYAFGNDIRVEGEVRGDVVAFGRQVAVSGAVGGDVIAAASQVRVTGPVEGTIRAAGGEIDLSSAQIGRDLVVAGGRVEIGPQTRVRDDLVAAGGEVRILSPVGGTVRAAGQKVRLDAPVGGDADVRAEEFRVGAQGAVAGTLTYASSAPAEIDAQARLGKVDKLPAPARIPPALAFLIGWARLAVGLFVLGLAFRWVSPRWSNAALTTLRQAPGRSAALGAAAVIGLPILAAVLFLLGALVGGWWVGLVVLVALGIAVTLAFPLVGIFVADWVGRRIAQGEGRRMVGTLLLGTVLLALALQVPILGAVVAVATILFGLGALLLGGWSLRRQPAAA